MRFYTVLDGRDRAACAGIAIPDPSNPNLAWTIHEGLGMIARRFARQVGLDRRSQ